MGKGSLKRRRFIIRLKAKRKEKIEKLKKRYLLAETKEEKEKIIEKALRINPNLTRGDFLKSLENFKLEENFFQQKEKEGFQE